MHFGANSLFIDCSEFLKKYMIMYASVVIVSELICCTAEC